MMYQEKLYSIVDSFTLDTLPRTILLLGEYGCGKSTLISHISSNIGLDIEDISDNLTTEYIDDITLRVVPKIYTINTERLTIKNENVILKFLEEPLKNAYIILTAHDRRSVIPTVLNRCQVWKFDDYPKDYLVSLVSEDTQNKDFLLKVATTPGKIDLYKSFPLSDMFGLASKIFDNIKVANFANVMTIDKSLAFKQEKGKYDVDLFFEILLIVSSDNCKSNTHKCYEVYELTRKLNENKFIFNVDKKLLFDEYLIKLKMLL